MTNITQIWFEVHPREESMMNRLYSKSKLNLIYKGKNILLSYHPTITRNVNTRYHKCNEDNSIKITSCYDNFYMKKLNCSFPWLVQHKNLNGGSGTPKPFDMSKSPIMYKKCGHDHHIDKLVEIIKATSNPNDELTKELEDFGCTIPNCETTEWIEEAYQTFDYGVTSKTRSKIEVQFSSSRKVLLILWNEKLDRANINQLIC